MIGDKKFEAMLEDIDATIGEWSREKLEIVILRARMFRRRGPGRKLGFRFTDLYHEAVREAGDNLRLKREAWLDAHSGKTRTEKGWEERTILTEINSSNILHAEHMKEKRDVVEAIRKAAKPVKRIRGN
jgi:hypothetical protein